VCAVERAPLILGQGIELLLLMENQTAIPHASLPPIHM
jgi:hypothetical protein